MTPPVLYLDLASPYAYLAAERAPSLFGGSVEFQPVLLGAIFKLRGSGSWAATDHRSAGMAEIERRARRYGLPPIEWPPGWPLNALAADRAAVWATRQGVGKGFMRALYRREFAGGADISRLEVIAAAGHEVGLDGGELLDAIQSREIKERLRRATDAAWGLGVRGVPSIRVGEAIFYGDDQLESAAAADAG